MIKICIAWISLLIIFLFGLETSFAEKILIGETAWISVEGVPFAYLARIDTGARTTSIHAVDVAVINGSTNPKENVGKIVVLKQLIERDGLRPYRRQLSM